MSVIHGPSLTGNRANTGVGGPERPGLPAMSERLSALRGSGAGTGLHIPFILGALLVILTAGASWGVLLLLKIGAGGSFTGVTVFEVNAHGHAQIMGWVGLFVMGMGYRLLPRVWGGPQVSPRFAYATLGCVIVGIMCRATGLAAHTWSGAEALHAIGVLAQAIGVGGFIVAIWRSWRASAAPLTPGEAFVFGALGFLGIQVLVGGWHMSMLIRAETREALLHQISTYQAPLRDLQIHGMAMLMIFGVGLLLFPALFGFREVPSRRAWVAFGLLLSAIVLETGLFIAFRFTESRAFAGAMLAPWLMLPTGAAILIAGWRPRRSTRLTRVSDPARKFVIAAFVWLFVSFGLLLSMPLYLIAYEGAFSHAYHGAIRHAITVGFISMMIVGMGSKLVPIFRGENRALPMLWVPFVLLNLGCALRVGLQIATDWHDGAFPVIALSGVLEVSALAWWALVLVATMIKGSAGAGENSEQQPAYLASYHTIGQTIAWFPQTRETLADMGFAPIRNPVLRRTLARRVTLAQAAAIGKVPLARLLDALNDRIGARVPDPDTSPSCDGCCAGCESRCRGEGTAGVYSPQGGDR